MTAINSTFTASSLLAQMGAYARGSGSSAAIAASAASVQAPSSTGTGSSATNVTLSDQALALLAAQGGEQDFATVTANARVTLDRLYADANVSVPLAGGKPTIDLTGIDRRTLFAIAGNSMETFTADEQTAADNELQRRFDAAIGPKVTAADLVGDYRNLYKAGLDYLDGMSAEEKATTGWALQRAALAQGYDATRQNPSVLPTGIDNDPIADYIARIQQDPASAGTQGQGSVADEARAALDGLHTAATRNGKELVFDPGRKSGQLVDWSGFDNQSLSAIVLDQSGQFTPQEARAAKNELHSRTRATLLQTLQQAGGDFRMVGYGVLSQYAAMSSEERQVLGWGTDLRDVAIKSYQTSSTVLAMLDQSLGGGSGLGLLG